MIWASQKRASGTGGYQRQYEAILYGWPQGREPFWGGGRNQSDLWSIPRPAAAREYSDLQPVELVERAIRNSSAKGGAILDPFGGWGTTLIACQLQGRKARLIEVNPARVDVICRRWQEYTGEPAVLDGDGRTFEEVTRDRTEAITPEINRLTSGNGEQDYSL